MRSVVGARVRGAFGFGSFAFGSLGLLAAFAVSALLLAAPQQAGADVVSGGEIRIQINVLDPIVLPQSPATVAPTGVSRNGNAIATVGLPAGLFATTGFVVPVTDEGAFPIAGIQATASNAAANFANTGMGLGGQMGLIGSNKVCLFGPCSAAVQNLNVPLNVVGIGGVATVVGAVNLTVLGASWTTGTAQIGTITRMGGTSAMVNGTAVTNDVTLVTPVFVSTNIGASAVVPVFGTLVFTVTPSPEPGTIAGLGAAIAALTAVGLSRRKTS
jgi:hypothetical protein